MLASVLTKSEAKCIETHSLRIMAKQRTLARSGETDVVFGTNFSHVQDFYQVDLHSAVNRMEIQEQCRDKMLEIFQESRYG